MGDEATLPARQPSLAAAQGRAGVLAVSGRVVRPGNQDDLLVNSAERPEIGVERAACGPHDQDPVAGFQELQDFGELLSQAFGLVLGEREGRAWGVVGGQPVSPGWSRAVGLLPGLGDRRAGFLSSRGLWNSDLGGEEGSTWGTV